MFIISPCCLFAEAAEVAIFAYDEISFVVVKDVVLFDTFLK
jgi:hypothetical protein